MPSHLDDRGIEDDSRPTRTVTAEPQVIEVPVRKPVKTTAKNQAKDSRPTRTASFEPVTVEGLVRKPEKKLPARGTLYTLATSAERSILARENNHQPQRFEELDKILEFLTGRAIPTPHPSDPPADVPMNVTQRTKYHPPVIPSAAVLGDQEASLQRWIYEAARYNNIPVVLMAVILQQENSPRATETRRQLQAGERLVEREAAELDEDLWGIVPDAVAGGSTGIANLSRATLRNAASYLEKRYHKPVIPDSIKKEKCDPRIGGIDEQLDFYYMSALLRQLIDRRVAPGHIGNISDEQLRLVAQDYNGSGPKAIKYGKDALARLNAARLGIEPLYFLGEPPGTPSVLLEIDKARGLGF